MKKILSLVLVAAFAFTTNVAFADTITGSSTVSHDINLSLDVTTGISITCDHDVTMNPIAQDGRSTIDANNEADCTVRTNDSDGYKVEVASTGTNGTDLTNANSDDIVAISNGVTEGAWPSFTTDSGWGYRLKSGAGDSGRLYNSGTWGSSDGYAGNFAGSNASANEIATVSSETDADGDTFTLQFGAEIGTSKIQPTGTYTGAIVVTATTLL